MPKRVIKHKVYTYHVEIEDQPRPDGTVGPLLLERMARRGEEVDLRDADANRGDALDAFYTPEELKRLRSPDAAPVAEGEGPAASLEMTEADVDEIRNWLEGNLGSRPSVPKVLSAVQSVEDEEVQAALAKLVLEAEQSRTDGKDPRSSLVEGLEEILSEDEPPQE